MQLEMAALKADHRKYLIAEMQFNYPVLHNLKMFLAYGFWIINERYGQAHNDYGIKSTFVYLPANGVFQLREWRLDVQGGSWILFKDGKHHGWIGSENENYRLPYMLKEAEDKIENETS